MRRSQVERARWCRLGRNLRVAGVRPSLPSWGSSYGHRGLAPTCPVVVGLPGQPSGPNRCGRGEALFEKLVGAFAHQRREDVTAVVKGQLNAVPQRPAPDVQEGAGTFGLGSRSMCNRSGTLERASVATGVSGRVAGGVPPSICGVAPSCRGLAPGNSWAVSRP